MGTKQRRGPRGPSGSGNASGLGRAGLTDPKPRQDSITRRALDVLERRGAIIATALVLLATLRMIATYRVFNHTADEPAHVACGIEWLDQGVYRWEPQHPPLARVAAALGPYLLGIRPQGTPRDVPFAMFKEGSAMLFSGHRYELTLAAARAGILPFFWIACTVVYLWGRRLRPAAGVAAVFVFTFLQPVLAHGGLATTDMALTAFLGAAFLSGLIWLESPTAAHGIIFGIATGLMVLSKFSGLVFFPAAVAVSLAWYGFAVRPKPRWLAKAAWDRVPTFIIAVLVACLLIWAGYRFSFGRIPFADIRLPAPELFAGIQQVQQHNAEGHDGYLLGTRSKTGFWNFYLVGLAVKTPLPVLILACLGVTAIFRKRSALTGPSTPPAIPRLALGLPLAFLVGILLVGVFSRINIGIRHVLPIYISIALLAAVAVLDLLEKGQTRPWIRSVLAALLVWFAAGSLWSHPDYLPYFNELAGSEPEKILADSDLDWGQDLKRLAHRLQEAGAQDVTFNRYIVIDLKELGFPRVHPMNQMAPSVGWNAIGVGLWKESRLFLWPDWTKPRERVGKSILLWYFPPR